jgi:hypothetical protein
MAVDNPVKADKGTKDWSYLTRWTKAVYEQELLPPLLCNEESWNSDS